jgi:hypothetical protein
MMTYLLITPPILYGVDSIPPLIKDCDPLPITDWLFLITTDKPPTSILKRIKPQITRPQECFIVGARAPFEGTCPKHVRLTVLRRLAQGGEEAAMFC